MLEDVRQPWWVVALNGEDRETMGRARPESNSKPSPGTKNGSSPRTRDRVARERALLAAASRLFAARGFEATTTREIASEAGCAEGLIHRYFRGKTGLLFALIRMKVADAASEMDASLQPAGDLQRQIINLVEFELTRVWNNREYFRVVIPSAICNVSIGKIARDIGPGRRARHIAAHLKRVEGCRELSDHEIESIAYFVGAIGLMFGFMHPAVLGMNRDISRKLAMSITKTFVEGLHGKAS